MLIKSTTSKRSLHHESPLHAVSKKLRSNIPRRRRHQISPVLLSGENLHLSVVSVDSSSCSDFAGGGEVSCDSSRISDVLRTRSRNEIESDHRFEKRNENEVEVSDNSCVYSNSGVCDRSRSLMLKFKSGKENDEASEVCAKSEISFAENSKSSNGNLNISSETMRNDVVSVCSGAREASFIVENSISKENRASDSESEYTRILRNRDADENSTDLIAQSIMKKHPEPDNSSGYDSDLACSEQLQCSSYYDDSSEYFSSQGTSFSDLHSEISGENSDYTPSLSIDSGSEFSQGSVGETPSHTYSVFLQYREEFTTLDYQVNNTSKVEEDFSLHHNFSRFEDLEDEESYQMLRNRERRQVFMWNYAERYLSATDLADLVLQQRSQMVHWIVEHAFQKQLRQETLFLGINLLDRFLSKGYFKAERNLQIVGIACLTLATRIEENQ